MNMKGHILTALRDQFEAWEELLRGMSEEQITTALTPSNWTCKDNIAHLMAWQQRSIARIEAAVSKREPDYPKWPEELDPNIEDVEQINAWIYETYRDQPWSEVHADWKKGFLRFLAIGEKVAEKDLLDSGKYPWMKGIPLAFTLLASYDHHQEHLEKLMEWLEEHRNKKING
jgi:hypothetical protein